MKRILEDLARQTAELRDNGLYKAERVITSTQTVCDPTRRLTPPATWNHPEPVFICQKSGGVRPVPSGDTAATSAPFTC